MRGKLEEALRWRQKMATQILANVEEEWMTSMEKEECIKYVAFL